MRNLDFSPFYRSTVGFDRLFDLLDSASKVEPTASGYPPYDIERVSDDQYRITLAVAGFGEDELNIETRNNELFIAGERSDGSNDRTYLHQGIAGRSFKRRFQLADYVKVAAATLENGLLHVDLAREIPEAMKPRKIEISKGKPAKILKGPHAA